MDMSYEGGIFFRSLEKKTAVKIAGRTYIGTPDDDVGKRYGLACVGIVDTPFNDPLSGFLGRGMGCRCEYQQQEYGGFFHNTTGVICFYC